jgi:hypothetical protein
MFTVAAGSRHEAILRQSIRKVASTRAASGEAECLDMILHASGSVKEAAVTATAAPRLAWCRPPNGSG